MTIPIHLGISTCPNDTFTFHALMQRRVDWRGCDFRVDLLDVEELNERLLAGEFDVAKASFHAALHLSAEMGVLPTGSALGFGVGPLLLASRPNSHPAEPIQTTVGRSHRPRVLCPGKWTTATMLYRLFHPGAGDVQQVVFSQIMPALVAGQADFGVCIHEGRFTWQDQGLSLVEDLGQRWERETGGPLPLGGILARRRLGNATLRRVQAVIADSLQYGLAHREDAMGTMRRYAQEMDDRVLWAHVDLYVNRWTQSLGDEGRDALAQLSEKAAESGLVAAGPILEVMGE